MYVIFKAAIQGADHQESSTITSKKNPLLGHEFAGEIIKVGDKWKNEFKEGQKFSIQHAVNVPERPYDAPGYSYQYIGGAATYIVIPNEFMERKCLLHFSGDAFYQGSLAEPISCIVGAFHASYHTKAGVYEHEMGIVEGGKWLF